MDRRRFLEAWGAMGLGSLASRCTTDAEPPPEAEPPELIKTPWAQVVGPARVRLRFETRGSEAVPVVLSSGGGVIELTPTTDTREVTFARDIIDGDPNYFPDEPGTYTVQEVLLDELEPGVVYGYTVGDGMFEGEILAPPTVGTAHRVGWLSDTSWPFSEDSVAVLSARAPDLFVHGGDLQYQTSPLDTWNGMSQSLAPITSRAIAHLIVGNHEFEDQDEIEQMYDRLYAGQGEANDVSARYFAFSFGGVRWIALDTETGDLATDDAQLAWLEQELAAAASSGDVLHAVVAFHRPVYTLSKHFPSSTATRDALHPLFVEHGVQLVMQGHAHCYERFVVDGIHYVVDGGGGALLYDPNEDLEKADAERPGESGLRVAVSESYGATVIDFEEDGSIAVERVGADGASTDAFTIA